jgi:hypothetical protein
MNAAQEQELRAAAVQSTSSVRINLDSGGNDLSRELAVAFARAFPTIDQKKANEMLLALNGAAPKGGRKR